MAHRTGGSLAGFIVVLCLGSAGAATPSEPAVAHQIVIEGVSFSPKILVVKSGEWVQWINKDAFPHTVTSPGEFDSRSIPPGGIWKHKVRKVGDFEYLCTLHSNMKATLRVEK